MGETGCYDLCLYCDGENCKAGGYGTMPAEATFIGSSLRAARREARQAGWKFTRKPGHRSPFTSDRGMRTLCPDCARLTTQDVPGDENGR